MEAINLNADMSYGDYFEVYEILKDTIFGKSHVSGISLMLNCGNVVSYYNAGDIVASDVMKSFIEKNDFPSERGWCYYTHGGQIDYVFYTCSVLTPYTMENLGRVVIQVDSDFFEDKCRKHLSTDYDIMLAADDDGVIYSSDENGVKLWEEKISRNIISEAPRTVYSDMLNNHMLISLKINETNWNAMIIYRYFGLYGDILWLLLFEFLLCIISVIIIFFIAHRLDEELIKPTYSLVKAMENTDDDGIAEDVMVIDDNEFAYVFEHFNSMNARIRLLLEQNYKKQINVRDMQLNVLQSQINPHFLFNTLQSIHWMSEAGRNEDVSRMVLALSKIMEYPLRDSAESVLLKSELEYIDKYIELIKARYEDGIVYTKNISANAEQVKVPKLIIQPFVENCIGHAKKSGAVLHIEVKADVGKDGYLVIEVCDDGKGMSKEKLEKVKTWLNQNTMVENTGRIGIANVNTRIRILCGGKCGVYIESEEDKYTRVKLVLTENKEADSNDI